MSSKMDEDGPFSASTYFRRFDSWNDALEAAGLPRTDESKGARISARELLDELSRMADVLHRPPTTAEMDELGAYSASTYRRRFSSWEDALQEAGVGSTDPREKPNKISEEKLLDELRALAADLGRSPTAAEMSKEGSHSPATYLDRYGTWNAALDAADLETRRFRRIGISDRELIRALQEMVNALGRRPQRQEMEQRGPFSGTTYYNRFGSWSAALEAAGLRTEDGVAYVTTRCDACALSIREPMADVPVDDGVYCSESCLTNWGGSVVSFESDVLDGADADVLGRIASLLGGSGPTVSEVVYLFDHLTTFLETDFEAVYFDNRRADRSGDAITVTASNEATSRELRFETDTVGRVRDRIEAVGSDAGSGAGEARLGGGKRRSREIASGRHGDSPDG